MRNTEIMNDNSNRYARIEATVSCRAAADKLAAPDNRDQTVLFPGWDIARTPAIEKAGCEAIRRTAAAILGDESAESGTTVTMSDLADLVRYIADMMEE